MNGNRPFGITFAGKEYSEGILIRIAYGYEQATNHRKPVSFVETE